MRENFRSLDSHEIRLLKSQDCQADSWENIRVAPDFEASRLRGCRFSGEVRLGKFTKEAAFYGGLTRRTGLTNAVIHNCSIGDDVYVNGVHGCLANYDIENEVVIEDVKLLAVEGPSSFGNGAKVRVINEAGGREVMIYDYLSSHIAYLMALHRDDELLVRRLTEMVESYTASVTSHRGRIGGRTKIIHCGVLKNIRVGEAAVLEGVSRLENGTILSKSESPSEVGAEVIAEDFIFATGSIVRDGVNVSRCFIGQAAELGRHYSAVDSLFFANCVGFHGEACSIFAGPYTVTHHKSTLLIAGFFSFLNAGSGSNQSNHMYKLGPVHQGIVERGSKTSSDSYMLWPMRVGAFTLIMGRHYGNADTTQMPFSYLIEHDGESNLEPGVNLRSVGTIRDSKNWPTRDRRRDGEITDYINFQLLNPYTVEKMCQGVKLLKAIRDGAGHSSRNFYFNGVKMRRSSLERGIELYQLGIRRYLGNVVMTRLRSAPITSPEELSRRFAVTGDAGRGRWLDWAGLYLPEKKAILLLTSLKEGAMADLREVDRFFQREHKNFEDYEFAWVDGLLRKRCGKPLGEFRPDEFQELIADWIEAVEKLDRLRCADARKEFAQTARVGYGLNESRDADFTAVRGSIDDNEFILGIEKRLTLKKQSAAELTAALGAL